MKSRTLVLYTINFFSLVTTTTLRYALEGKNITLKTDIGAQGPPDEILWKHNGNKVVEFNGQQQREYSPFEHRLTLDWHTADLEIRRLQYDDSGDYVLETFTKTILTTLPFKLQVIEPVPKPSISCAMNGERNATLTCTAELKRPQSNLEFSWVPPGKEKSSPKLEIKLGGQKDSEVYKCTVRNQQSEESASFTAKDCYDKNNPAGLIVGIIIGLLVLIVAVAVCFYKKGCLRKQDSIDGHSDQEKQAPLGGAIVGKEGNGTGKDESKHLLAREETMPSNQPLPQWEMRDESKKDPKEDLEETQNTNAHAPPAAAKPNPASNIHRGDKTFPDALKTELKQSIRKRNLEKQQQEIPSPSPQPPLKPSRSVAHTPKIQSHPEEGNGDAEEKGPQKPPSYETNGKPEENQHEVSPSPLQPPAKPSRSIARPPKSQSHSKEGEVSGDATEKDPENEPPPTEKTNDVEAGSEKNILSSPFPVLVQVHSHSTPDTELPNETELIQETEVSGSHSPGPEQNTGTDSDSEKKEKVSSPPPVLPRTRHASVTRKESNKPAEKAEANASGIHPADVLPGSDVVEDEHKQPEFGSDVSVSVPSGLPASPSKAVEPEPKDVTTETEAPPGAEEDEQLPPADGDDDDAPKENGHEQDQSLDMEPNENFKTPPVSPTPTQTKAEGDGGTAGTEDEGEAAIPARDGPQNAQVSL